MEKSLKLIWQIVLLITILPQESYNLECSNANKGKCWCFENSDTEFQCPGPDAQLNLSVSKKHQISIQCLNDSTPYLDLDILPDVNVSDATYLKMEYCYINSSFSNVVNKFYVEKLDTLIFESITQKSNDDRRMSLTKESFMNLQSLERLILSYSTFNFSSDFLANTPNLLALTLSKCGIQKLDEYFKYTNKLKMLDLTANEITTLPDGIFKNLSNLTRLMLFQNNISSLSNDAFDGLDQLTLLELSNNHIQEVAADTFADLLKLVNLSLRGNKIKQMDSNTFTKNTLIENIRVGSNPGIVLSDFVFANLPMLQSVELYSNKLEMLPRNLFQNSLKLQKITLQNNMLYTLPEEVFDNLTKLETLDLSLNKLKLLPNQVFHSLVKLQELNLSKNQLTFIDKNIFKFLFSLKRLDLRSNAISVIELRAFDGLHKSLTHLDLSYNKWNNTYGISSGAEKFRFSPLNNLINQKELILGHNEITVIPELVSFTKLEKLDLSYNRINSLQMTDFTSPNSFTFTIDLSHNQIRHIDFDFAETIAKSNIGEDQNTYESIVLDLMGNPIQCDCLNYDLVRYNHNEMEALKSLVNIRQDDLVCADYNNTMVADLKLSDIDCPVSSGCPGACICAYKPYNKAVVVDCSFNNLTAYPDLDIHMDDYSYNQTFLTMSGNKLHRGPTAMHSNYSNITVLDLSGNLISELEWIPPHLKELNLNDNLLKNLDRDFIKKLANVTTLKRLNLKGNPWECSCKSLHLKNYLEQHHQKVNTSDVYCQNSHEQLVKITDICATPVYVAILVPLGLAVLLIFAMTFALYYRFQIPIKVWLYANNCCMWFVTEDDLDKHKTYDVFISFANQDEQFVVDKLLSELEHGDTRYKVCIHLRDWVPGMFIAEQVVNSVKDSRRTLVVLTNHFLESVWGKMEFRTAHTEAIMEGRGRVIVVIKGDIDESKLDDELKNYLKTNTYVKWGDKYFWNKLRYALPHSRNRFYESNKRHANVMLKIDDKFNLIKNPPSPSNTSTPPIITLDPSLLESKDSGISLSKSLEGEDRLLAKEV